MNWGKGIALVLILFILGLAFLVYKTTEVTSEMVTDNYYEKELAYEEVIEGKRNLQKLSEEIQVKIDAEKVSIQFPKELIQENIKGNILFYRPSDPKKDRTTAIALKDYVQNIDIQNFITGNYQVQITFEVDGNKYYFEKNIYIP